MGNREHPRCAPAWDTQLKCREDQNCTLPLYRRRRRRRRGKRRERLLLGFPFSLLFEQDIT